MNNDKSDLEVYCEYLKLLLAGTVVISFSCAILVLGIVLVLSL